MALDTGGLGLRIAEARQRAGLKQEDLAHSSGLDRTAIAKIETGVRRVTALELARLADALGERIEWFLEDPTPSIVSHRNMVDPGEPSPQIDTVIERVAQAVEFTARNDAGLREALRELLPFEEPTDAAETETLAESARDLVGADRDGPVQELSSLLATAGVLTYVADLGRDSADAGSVLLRKGAVAVVSGNLRTGRRRLALAHEFGHVLIADPYTVDWRVDGSTQDVRERGIDRFARAFLLPHSSLESRWREWGGDQESTTRTAAVRTASFFRVDMSTLARRLLDIGLINAGTASYVRTVKTNRADILEHNLVVADELPMGELPRAYESAVLRLFTSEKITDVRALDLLFDTWDLGDLPELAPRSASEIWKFVS